MGVKTCRRMPNQSDLGGSGKESTRIDNMGSLTVTIPAQDPWQNEIEWYSDIVQTGEVDATKKTTPGGFFLSINAMTNIFNATGNLTTVIDGKKYTQPANGT